jgi:hypothetical protein
LTNSAGKTGAPSGNPNRRVNRLSGFVPAF